MRWAARADRVEFTEMLPAPDECWLETAAGHHTSELRIIATPRSNSNGSPGKLS
jgi:hypothetical protein